MTAPKEGTLHKRFEIAGVTFEIYYGFSTGEERRRNWDPSPIYPDFSEHPQYTKEGEPFAVVYGVPCEFYAPFNDSENEWCENCKYFEKHEQYIGVCKCEERRLKSGGKGNETQSS